MALRPSSVPLRVPLPAPPESSLPEVPDPGSDRARAASPTVARLLATAVTDSSFESAAASALVAELLDFAAACRLDYASALVAESVPASPPSVGGECALGTDVLEDRQEEFECLAAAVPRFASLLLAPKGDPDAPDIPTSRSYAEAITGTQWSLRRPVYGLRQAPHEWHDTLRTTLAALGFAPSTADPSLFLRTDILLPPFYVLVYLGLQITRDRARRTITLTQSRMVHQVLQRFGFQYSSPQLTPLSTSHSLSAPPLDKSVELSAPPAPPAPPSPPTPPAPPAPPAPLAPPNPPDIGASAHQRPAPPPASRWGQPEANTWDESAVGADDDVAADKQYSGDSDGVGDGEAGAEEDVFPDRGATTEDDDGVESWWRDAPREKMPIPTYPPINKKRPHPSSLNRDARPPSPRHKPSQHKRQSYTSQEKIMWLVRLELAASVSEVARESSIHRKCLTEWKSQAEELKASHAARCRLHGRGRSSWYRPMELKVYAQLLDWRRRGVAVSVGRLQEWSREVMKVLFPEVKWKGSQRWSERFRKQWNLSCKEFWQFVRDARNEYAIDNRYIINADQTPLWLEMPATTTVEQTGVKSVPIRSAGYQKERVTVMLACTATGEKLKPWVFFKRKTLPKGDFPNNVVVGCQANGWMEATGVIQWLDEGVVPFLKPKFGVQSRSAMLVLDSYRGHLTKEVKARFAVLNIVPAVIPAGCTADVQPLDVSMNKSFKARNIKKPPPEVVLKWISRAWKAVPGDLIKKTFLTCGISNALDGSEDHLVMAQRRSQLSHEVEVDDDIQANGLWGNNSTEPKSDVEEVEA
ncbi:unnamed protein product [Closterium sp. NIES-54]